MRLESTVSLLAPKLASLQNKAAGPSLASLANQQAATKLGVVPGELPGSYQARYASTTREVTEQVKEDRAITRTDPIYANRDITEQRNVYEDRAIYEERAVYTDQAVYETQGVFEDRAIMESRNVYEMRGVFEDRNVMATRVDGTRALNTYNSTSQAGIDLGADFSVQVGNGTAAVLTFDAGSRVSLTMNGQTTRFTYNSYGSVGGAVAAALNNVSGLNASLSSDGKLRLETTNAQSLKLADIANGLLDFSRSPLASLGLVAGTTNAGVVGTERVQTGTEQVVVGTQQVQVGTERIQTGTQQVQTGTQRVQTGTEQVRTGVEQILLGTQSIVVGTERFQVGSTTNVVGKETVVTGTKTRTEEGPRTLVGLEESDDYGVGELLSQLQEGSLPDGYIEALFGTLDAADLPPRYGFAGAAYREASGFGKRDDIEAPKRLSIVARNEEPKSDTRAPAAVSGE